MKLLDVTSLFRRKQNRKINNPIIEQQAKKALKRGKETHSFGGVGDRDTRSIYVSQHRKLKGYQKQGLRSFNKNK